MAPGIRRILCCFRGLGGVHASTMTLPLVLPVHEFFQADALEASSSDVNMAPGLPPNGLFRNAGDRGDIHVLGCGP